MARGVAVSVHYGDRVFYADVDPGERADQLLVRSLYHFGIDPGDKHRYRLIRRGRTDPPTASTSTGRSATRWKAERSSRWRKTCQRTGGWRREPTERTPAATRCDARPLCWTIY